MRKIRLIMALLTGASFLSTLMYGQQLAFPSAEGFGRYATGGRGGTVYHVTNLNDSGPGSFRDAVSQSNRTVVFDVGGVINISSRIVVSSNVTVAGQTAPGEGITIYGNGLSYSNANNTITRYIRFRMGKIGDSGKDAIAIADGHDMIFDHVSISWGRDGTFDLNGDVGDVTLQNSIIGQGLQTHSTGGLIQSSGGVSVLRNLYIDNHTRNPKVKGYNQYINNVVYNWAVAGYILGDSEGYSEANVLNNYFIEGPETSSEPFNRANENFHLYANGNYWDSTRNGVLDGVVIDSSTYGPVTWSATPYNQPAVTTTTAQQAYAEVFANAGASLHRDQVDDYMINELASLGTLGATISDETSLPTNGPGVVAGGPAYPDTDGDGMPDYYETARNLNPNNAADGSTDADNDGYTNLEEYLNCLVGECDSPMPTPPPRTPRTFNFNYDGNGNHSWEWFNNWDLGYLPAAGDTVIIASGEAELFGDKSGIITYVQAGASLNITGTTRLDELYMQGGALKGSAALSADVHIDALTNIYGSGLSLTGDLSGDEKTNIYATGAVTLNTNGSNFTGRLIVHSDSLIANAPNSLGNAYVELKDGAVLNLANVSGFDIAFLEVEQGGMVHINQHASLRGGKFGNQRLTKARRYHEHNSPQYIDGNGSFKMSKNGTYDCTFTWNGTAYRDDCYTCVGGTTDRNPCDTTLSEGVYRISPTHSALCIEADSNAYQADCTQAPSQAFELEKAGPLYRIKNLNTNTYLLPYYYDGSDLHLDQTSMSTYATGYYRIEKSLDSSFSITPVLRPDDMLQFADSSAGTLLMVGPRANYAHNMSFNIYPYYDCNGSLGGLAFIDDCGFCAGGTTGQVACTGGFEAEEYCLLDGYVETHPDRDYFGDGYLNYDNATGTKATYNFVSTSAQTLDLKIRYGNGSSNRPLRVVVNGTEQVANLDFPGTGDWNNWEFIDVSLSLDSGENYVQFIATTSAGAANIDNFALFTSGVSLGVCPPLDCYGTPNGTAFLDSCDFCVGGTTGVNPCVGSFEAEAFCELDGVIEAIPGRGWSGTGYLNYDNAVGTKASYNIEAPNAMSTTLRVRYANGSSNRPLKVVVNGTEQLSNVPFPATGGWADWEFVDLPLSFTAGSNLVELVSISSGGAANLDLIVYTDNVSLGACPGSSSARASNESENPVMYYPNPFERSISLHSTAPFSYKIYDQKTGAVLESGIFESEAIKAGETLAAGFYILRAFRNDIPVLEQILIKQ